MSGRGGGRGGREGGREGGTSVPGDDHGGDQFAGTKNNLCGVVDVVQGLEGGREGGRKRDILRDILFVSELMDALPPSLPPSPHTLLDKDELPSRHRVVAR